MTATNPESRLTSEKVTALHANGAAAASAPPSDIELTEFQPLRVGIPDVVAVVRRRLKFITTIVLSATLLAIVACLFLTRIYTASSTLVLERRDIRPFETDLAAQTLDRDRSAAETEMDVLRSRQFAERVVDELDLASNPDFNPLAKTSQNSTSSSGWLDRILGTLSGKQTEEGQSDAGTAEFQRDYAVSLLLSQVRVSRTGESLAVRVEVSNSGPKLAAKIANTIADTYVQSSLEFKQSARTADKARAMRSGGAVAFLRERTAQPLLITLRGEEARLAKEREELANRYGNNHPKMIGYDSQIASVRRMIDEEVGRILQDLEIDALKPSARVVSRAAVPTSPSFPKPQLIIPGVFVGSALLAFLLALILEAVDNKIRSGTRVSQLLRIPNLGYVPRLASLDRASTMIGIDGGTDLQQSVFDEAIRSIYLACRAPESPKQLNFVLVSACLEDAASAATAWGLAAAGAADGRKVIFANLDPSQRDSVKAAARDRVKRFLKNEMSLAALIGDASKTVGTTNLVDATDELSELSRTLNSKNFRNILVSLRRIGYDLIVLHAPPVLVVSDAVWLSQLVDGVLLTIAWGRTTEKELVDAVTELRVNGAPIIGTLIDDVDPVVQFRDGYGGRLTYYRQTRSHLVSRA
jgi:uncharacterized protein involved in exopolysaccharide biosynthesis/Mrp family chromosome partitioning ATPase